MPQLDVLTFSSQLFWFLICFSLLFFIVNCLFLPKLDETISTRNQGILDSFNSSIFLLKFAENQVNKYNAILQQANMEAKEIISNALAKVEKMKINAKDVLKEEMKEMNKLIEEEIAKFKIEHIDTLKRMSADIVLIYYAKLTGSQVKEGLVTNLISKKF